MCIDTSRRRILSERLLLLAHRLSRPIRKTVPIRLVLGGGEHRGVVVLMECGCEDVVG